MEDFSAEATARRAAAHEMMMRMRLHVLLNFAVRRIIMAGLGRGHSARCCAAAGVVSQFEIRRP